MQLDFKRNYLILCKCFIMCIIPSPFLSTIYYAFYGSTSNCLKFLAPGFFKKKILVAYYAKCKTKRKLRVKISANVHSYLIPGHYFFAAK